MTTFRIGQPVRLTRHIQGPDKCRKYLGCEGVVTSSLMEKRFYGEKTPMFAHHVQLLDGTKLWCIPDELEPIVPRGDPLIAVSGLMPELEDVFAKVFENA
jgi:hypothetical protein